MGGAIHMRHQLLEPPCTDPYVRPRAENAMTILRGQRHARMGALATLRAATDPAARGGEYYGPERFQGWAGHPVRVGSGARSYDTGTQRLWAESERLTGVIYQFATNVACN